MQAVVEVLGIVSQVVELHVVCSSVSMAICFAIFSILLGDPRMGHCARVGRHSTATHATMQCVHHRLAECHGRPMSPEMKGLIARSVFVVCFVQSSHSP